MMVLFVLGGQGMIDLSTDAKVICYGGKGCLLPFFVNLLYHILTGPVAVRTGYFTIALHTPPDAMNRLAGCICTIVMLMSTPALVVAQEITMLDSIDVFIEGQAERYHIPGIAAGVIKGDSLVWAKGYGWADLERGREMTPAHVMNIASISKTITATAVMQLWEQGLVDLNADINTYLPIRVSNPGFDSVAITIRQLLSHSSSVYDGPGYKEGYSCGDPSMSLSDWIEAYFTPDGAYYDAEENFHGTQPGAVYSYSNVGFGLLGYIVEQRTGINFHTYVKDNIFEPLEMNNTGYFLNEVDASKLVVPYLYLGPLQQMPEKEQAPALPYYNPYCMYSFWNYPDGLVRTSIEDLSRFAIAYMNGGMYKGRQILKAETIELMQSPQLDADLNEDQDQGLSWFYSPGLSPSSFHGGSDPGVSTRLYVDKTNKIGVIVFQNANADNPYYIARMLYRAFE